MNETERKRRKISKIRDGVKGRRADEITPKVEFQIYLYQSKERN